MKKIGIVTINDINYGNRLQAYATQEIFKKIGCMPENLFNGDKPYSGKRKKLIHLLKCITFDKNEIQMSKRINNYKLFNKNIKFSRFDIINDNKKDISDYYDFFFVGSDQVWNPIWMGQDIDFLCFTQKEKRNSISASFGVEQIPDNQIQRYKKLLNEFDNISVREEAGARIVKKLTGKDAMVLVDPTLLLTQEEWRKVSSKPYKIQKKKKYILTYFLSPMCEEAKKRLDEIRGEREVYELLNLEDNIVGTAGPAEFIWLFDNADLILTDSFHACIFSFIFDKPFIVFDRNWDNENMNSRLETLLSKFSLERKYYASSLCNDIWEHDYTDGYKQLEIEKDKFIEYISDIVS